MWRRGGVATTTTTTTMWNEDDDGVPMASYYLYDGTAEVPSDVTHVRVAPSVIVIRSDVFGSLGPYLVETSNDGFFLTKEESTRRAIIRKVILPQGLRCIEERAFVHCKSLTDIIIPEIPESVERIHDHYNASVVLRGLRNIAFPLGCDVDPSCRFESLTGLFPYSDDYDDNDDDAVDTNRLMLDSLRIRFEGLSIHKECYHQTFQDSKAVTELTSRD